MDQKLIDNARQTLEGERARIRSSSPRRSSTPGRPRRPDGRATESRRASAAAASRARGAAPRPDRGSAGAIEAGLSAVPDVRRADAPERLEPCRRPRTASTATPRSGGSSLSLLGGEAHDSKPKHEQRGCCDQHAVGDPGIGPE